MREVVAQLLDVRQRLAAATVTAMRAKADAEQVYRRYAEAAQGTEHPKIQEALTDIRTASEKATRTARLLNEARTRFTAYLNRIAPGSVPDVDVSEAEMPPGEQLVGDAVRRAESSSGIGAFLRRTSRNIENIQDAGKSATEAAQNTIRIIKNPFKPPGSQTTSTATGSPAQPSILQRIDAPEAVGNLLVVGVIAGVSLHRSTPFVTQEHREVQVTCKQAEKRAISYER
ncbi:hypothetical protein O7626_02450 [Micromonospora sp. WMMD1102]|uniref:hypothetical protein n=1 Tax=Micromonospora sp. WMMD1102 TaxID=3016105 RepID=UPI00241529E2|nr:hypothetical protein [Micromonospora sp. WMMD1102]MDG4784803.1 hypothetical protein [Micromonospora sp. WMMD1102]